MESAVRVLYCLRESEWEMSDKEKQRLLVEIRVSHSSRGGELESDRDRGEGYDLSESPAGSEALWASGITFFGVRSRFKTRPCCLLSCVASDS